MFFRSPRGKILLAPIDIVAPVSSTPRYSRPLRGIRTQNTRSVGLPECPCQNSAGQVTSNPFFCSFRAMRMKRERLREFYWSPFSLARLVPCSCWAWVWERVVGPVFDCPPEGSEFPPALVLGFPLDQFPFLSLSGLRSEPPRPPMPLPLGPLPLPLDVPLPLSLSALPLPLPLPLPFLVLSFAERRCLWWHSFSQYFLLPKNAQVFLHL